MVMLVSADDDAVGATVNQPFCAQCPEQLTALPRYMARRLKY
jgi:hypothetical protein